METVDKKPNQIMSPSCVDHSDVMAVLMHTEGRPVVQLEPTSSSGDGDRDIKGLSENQMSSDEESDWEEVENHHVPESPLKSQIPAEPVEITLQTPGLSKKKKKKTVDLHALFQRQLNKFQRSLRIDIHKVHMMCLLSYGMQKNNLCTEPLLSALGLSLLQPNLLPTGKRRKSMDLESLNTLLGFLFSTISIDSDLDEEHSVMVETLQRRMETKHAASLFELVMVMVIILRALGLDVRLVMSFQPITLKVSFAEKKKREIENCEASSVPQKKKKVIPDIVCSIMKAASKNVKTKMGDLKKCSFADSKTDLKETVIETSNTPSEIETSQYFSKTESRVTGSLLSSDKSGDTKKISRKRKSQSMQNSNNNSRDNERSNKRKKHGLDSDHRDRKSVKNKRISRKEEMTDDVVRPDDTCKKIKDSVRPQRRAARETAAKNREIMEYVKDDNNKEKTIKSELSKRKSKSEDDTFKGKATVYVDEDSSGSDFQVDDNSPRNTSDRTGSGRKQSRPKSAKAADKKKKAAVDQWIEVYLKSEDMWMCIDCSRGKIMKPEEISAGATQPLQYIVAYHNDGSLKDVTAKYDPQFLNKTSKKVRVSSEWWEETIAPFKSKDNKREKKEDAGLKAALIDKPFPTSIADFKGHPLYVLTRHLLKFEAIYPDTAIPLGYIRREPIYARELVHEMHSRETWYKDGLCVKPGELPYKMVKSRPKPGKKRDNPDALDLELFGKWQTETYVPPDAKDGKVPKNEYGSVELYQPFMLPGGTVQMTENGLNRIARKLGIDCAPAHTGWDFHGCSSHPVYEGIIVCKEFEEVLRNAWVEDQENQIKRQTEKREKRVYSHWKLFIKSLLIKERLKKRFNLEERKDIDKGHKEVSSRGQGKPQPQKKEIMQTMSERAVKTENIDENVYSCKPIDKDETTQESQENKIVKIEKIQCITGKLTDTENEYHAEEITQEKAIPSLSKKRSVNDDGSDECNSRKSIAQNERIDKSMKSGVNERKLRRNVGKSTQNQNEGEYKKLESVAAKGQNKRTRKSQRVSQRVEMRPKRIIEKTEHLENKDDESEYIIGAKSRQPKRTAKLQVKPQSYVEETQQEDEEDAEFEDIIEAKRRRKDEGINRPKEVDVKRKRPPKNYNTQTETFVKRQSNKQGDENNTDNNIRILRSRRGRKTEARR